ncbi:putative ATP-binding cassette [Cyclospora cayetanensis]|uniref:ATP-binding cassette n=1 Tax=Cyclospora cayetanensis TaxID=88456 RepID=A0A1D3D353_9EIME|nr:putative ATP-binding cassette [Cyclospora cayetanensis]
MCLEVAAHRNKSEQVGANGPESTRGERARTWGPTFSRRFSFSTRNSAHLNFHPGHAAALSAHPILARLPWNLRLHGGMRSMVFPCVGRWELRADAPQRALEGPKRGPSVRNLANHSFHQCDALLSTFTSSVSERGPLFQSVVAFGGPQRALPAFSRCLFVEANEGNSRAFSHETKQQHQSSGGGLSSDRRPLHPPSNSSSGASSGATEGSSSTVEGLQTGTSGPQEGPRVTLWDLLTFIKGEKFRIGGIICALLLSSGAQLLLPLAVGQLVDAVTQAPPVQLQEDQQHQEAQKRDSVDPHVLPCTDDEVSRPRTEGSSTATVDGTSATMAAARELESGVNACLETTDTAASESRWVALRKGLQEGFKTPWARLGFCLSLGAIGAATSFMRLYLLESTIERLACPLRSGLFRRLLQHPTENFQQQPLGALAKYMSQDVVTASRVLVDVSFGLRCALTSVIVFDVTLAASRRVAALQQQHSRALQVALQRATGALSSRKQLRSLNGEALEIKAFDAALRDVFAAAQKSAVAVAWRYAFVFAAGSGLLVHLVYAASSLVAQGVLTGGQVMSLALYSAIVGSSLQGCATAWSDTSRAVAATNEMLELLLRGKPSPLGSSLNYQKELDRFQKALQQQHHSTSAEAAAKHSGFSLKFKDVWLSYPGRNGQWALKGLSFCIPPGAAVAIVGPSGSGKSSVGALLLRLYEPQKGSILLGNVPINAFDERFIRSLVIPVVQDSLLVSGGLLESHIRYGQLAHQEISASPLLPLTLACDAACVSPFAATLPMGLKTPLDERGTVLSGGQRQRVCLAMALYRLQHAQQAPTESPVTGCDTESGGYKVPRVVLLDEATSSLDSDTERQVLHNIKENLRGETCLFVSHRPGTLEVADHIMVSVLSAADYWCCPLLPAGRDLEQALGTPRGSGERASGRHGQGCMQRNEGVNADKDRSGRQAEMEVLDAGRIIQFGAKEDVLKRPCAPLQWLVSGATPSGRGLRP